MGVSGGPNMIEDGLVLRLDASDRNSYVSGSTTWFDVSGNNNSGSLINGPLYTSSYFGGIYFDATDDYAAITSDTGSRQKWSNYWTGSSNEMTILCIMQADFAGSVTRRDGIIGQHYFSGNGFSFHIHSNSNYTNGILAFNIGSNGNFNTLSGPSYGNFTNTPIFVSLTHNGVTRAIRFSVNGSFYSTTLPQAIASGNYMSDITNNVRIIRYTSTEGYYPKTIHHISIYNRALSDSEVIQSYNALKSRFNL